MKLFWSVIVIFMLNTATQSRAELGINGKLLCFGSTISHECIGLIRGLEHGRHSYEMLIKAQDKSVRGFKICEPGETTIADRASAFLHQLQRDDKLQMLPLGFAYYEAMEREYPCR